MRWHQISCLLFLLSFAVSAVAIGSAKEREEHLAPPANELQSLTFDPDVEGGRRNQPEAPAAIRPLPIYLDASFQKQLLERAEIHSAGNWDSYQRDLLFIRAHNGVLGRLCKEYSTIPCGRLMRLETLLNASVGDLGAH